MKIILLVDTNQSRGAAAKPAGPEADSGAEKITMREDPPADMLATLVRFICDTPARAEPATAAASADARHHAAVMNVTCFHA